MRGITVNCKTGETEEQDDGLPMPEYEPIPEPTGLDLAQAKRDIEDLKAASIGITTLGAVQKDTSIRQKIVTGLAKLVGLG